MKLGLTSSIALHAAILGWAFLTLSAPKAFDVADVEAVPVDVVPFDSMSHVQLGDKKAPKLDKSAPKPTSKPKSVENAQNVGDNKVDLKTPPTPKQAPVAVQAAEQPKAAPDPAPKPEPQPTPQPKAPPPPPPEPSPPPKAAAQEPPAPAPEPQKTAEPQPAPASKPDAVAQAIAADSPDAPSVKLPDKVPTPETRPEPPKPQVAQAQPDRQDSKTPPAKPAPAKVASQPDKSLDDQIAALLNHEKSAGGGARRSEQTASLGGDKDTGGNTLTQSEMDGLRAQIEKCWNPPVGVSDAKDLKISVKMKLDPSGALQADPQVIAGGGDSMLGRVAAESAMRAVMRCAPYKLPADKYQSWADVIVNFDPSQMF
jgi:hypothetical protein